MTYGQIPIAGRLIPWAILAMLLHECGHIVTALALGVEVKRVGLCLAGIYTKHESGTPLQNFLIVLAGPLSNLYLALLFAGHHAAMFVVANLLGLGTNLLPLPGTDGWLAGKLAWRWLRPVASSQSSVVSSGGAQ